jgi:hypothetical protein
VLTGCQRPVGRTVEQFQFLQPGMAITQVVNRVGEPDLEVGYGQINWIYKLADGSQLNIVPQFTDYTNRARSGDAWREGRRDGLSRAMGRTDRTDRTNGTDRTDGGETCLEFPDGVGRPARIFCWDANKVCAGSGADGCFLSCGSGGWSFGAESAGVGADQAGRRKG